MDISDVKVNMGQHIVSSHCNSKTCLNLPYFVSNYRHHPLDHPSENTIPLDHPQSHNNLQHRTNCKENTFDLSES